MACDGAVEASQTNWLRVTHWMVSGRSCSARSGWQVYSRAWRDRHSAADVVACLSQTQLSMSVYCHTAIHVHLPSTLRNCTSDNLAVSHYNSSHKWRGILHINKQIADMKSTGELRLIPSAEWNLYQSSIYFLTQSKKMTVKKNNH